jgi:hypothetical protein
MSEHISRRTSLKGLGAMAVAVALGRSGAGRAWTQPAPAESTPVQPSVSAAELAAERLAQGHS